MLPIGKYPLYTDLYQLTMAYGYFRAGRQDDRAIFNLFFRSLPFGGGYAVSCGQGTVREFLRGFRFDDQALDYLYTLSGHDGQPLFAEDFLDYLKGMTLSVDVQAMPEGTLAFPHEPILRIEGPIIQCQLLETALLNIINFQTLIATKAARICDAAGGDPVLEFGLRRAQGLGGMEASRAAYIGGCAATSNVLAGMHYGIPVKGTHAHSWVMSFDDELEAFDTYADAMPNNCVFLVDTYNTLEGVQHAIEIGKRLRASGHQLLGIRLDSGDLCALGKAARQMLDTAGFTLTQIIASNDLDERLIASLRAQGAPIAVWGVGTKLVTGGEQSALGGVYKLAALQAPGGYWRYTVKLSEQQIKTSIPGKLQVLRYQQDGKFVGDVIYDELTSSLNLSAVDMADPMQKRFLPPAATRYALLAPLDINTPVCAYELKNIRAYVLTQLGMLPPGMRRFDNPQRYFVGLQTDLHTRRQTIINELRGTITPMITLGD